MSLSRAAWVAAVAFATLVPLSSGTNARAADDSDQLERAARASANAALSELRGVLSDPSLGGDRVNAIRRVLRSRLDYSKFSRFALARDTGAFSPEQRDRYECEFNEYLSYLLTTRLLRYSGEQFKITRAIALPNRDVVVSARISGGKHDGAGITLLMRAYSRALDQWRAIDIAFDGTRVRQTLRDRVEPALHKGGPDQLIAMLQQQTPRQPSCTPGNAAEAGSAPAVQTE